MNKSCRIGIFAWLRPSGNGKGLRVQASLAPPTLDTTLRFRIAASSILRADAATIESWRRQPIVVGTEKLPVSMLRHAEDQTLLSLKSVLDARTQSGCDGVCFNDWGVIAAASFFGRLNIATTLQRFQQEGAWGVSPHLIPHQSLHAISGTISQMLKIHGPNFGVGGGANSASDAVLLAAAMLADGNLPGLWLVVSGHAAERIPAADGAHPVAPECVAVALALTAAFPAAGALHLSIGTSISLDDRALLPLLDVGLLAEYLTAGKWRVGETHWMEVEATLEAEARS
jgi:hypothetical protein